MEYFGGRHYFFRNRDQKKPTNAHQADHSMNVINGIRLGHNHSLRSITHMNSRWEYQTWLEGFEGSTTRFWNRANYFGNIFLLVIHLCPTS
jgi:hypothetical protein